MIPANAKTIYYKQFLTATTSSIISQQIFPENRKINNLKGDEAESHTSAKNGGVVQAEKEISLAHIWGAHYHILHISTFLAPNISLRFKARKTNINFAILRSIL